MADRTSLLRSLYALSRNGFPFGVLPARSSVERLRRLRLRERFRARGRLSRWLLSLFAAATWPWAAVAEVRRNRGNVRRSGFVTTFHMLRLAVLRNVPPVEFAAYGFEDRAARALSPEYLYWTDTYAVKRLNRLRGANNDDVQDKVRFAQICGAHALPHVPTLAVLRTGKTEMLTDPAAMGAGDLWLKRTNLQGGVGTEVWRRHDQGYIGAEGAVLSFQQMLAHASKQDRLLQPRLRNHSQIEPFTNGSLASLRIVTACHRDGSISFLGNTLVLPQGAGATSAGGMACRVSREEGAVEKVLYAQREVVAAAVVGLRLPFWRESLDLVSRAHRTAFPLFATLGWDVALTNDGPLLLEANSGWGAVTLQQLWGPLGLTPFTALLEEEFAAER